MEFKNEMIQEVLRNISGNYRESGNQIRFDFCPLCHGGKKGSKRGDQQTFSINKDTGLYKCHRHTCINNKGNIFQLAEHLGISLNNHKSYQAVETKKQKSFKSQTTIMNKSDIKISDEAVEYFEKRGISKEVVEKFKVTTQKDNNNILVFPFFDASKEWRFTKYRPIKRDEKKPKEWCDNLGGNKPILFGMDNCSNDYNYVVITEGQIDSMSLATAGIKNTLSVPNGSNGFTWVDNCFTFLNKFQEIIVFGDFDKEKGKLTLIDEIYSKFLHLKVSFIPKFFYKDCKDANEILLKYKENYLASCLNHRIVKTSECIIDSADVDSSRINVVGEFETGVWGLDQTTRGFRRGELIILSGRRGEGKSTFLEQICINIISKKLKVFLYSGEMSEEVVKENLILKIAGRDRSETKLDKYGCYYNCVKDEYRNEINNYIRGRLYMFNNKSVGTKDFKDLLCTVEEAIVRKEVDVICIDNLMTSMHLSQSQENEFYRKQGEFVQKLCHISKKHKVAIILVSHPKKTEGELDNDAISGSSDITNLADTVIFYQRATDKDYVKYWESQRKEYNQNWQQPFDSVITLTKNRANGKWIDKSNPIRLKYDQSSKILTELNANPVDYFTLLKQNYISEFANDPSLVEVRSVVD